MNEKVVDKFPFGLVMAPPSKSYAHRALFCASIAGGESVIENCGDSEDVKATEQCLNSLCADIKREGGVTKVRGGVKKALGPLDCGESGTTLRLLMPLAKALVSGDVKILAKPSLLKRPNEPLLNALNGVSWSQPPEGYTLCGQLKPGHFLIPGDISSQYVSGLLIALSILGESTIELTSPLESVGYVDMTLDMMGRFGVEVEREGYEKFSIKGAAAYKPQNIRVEGDYSSIAFFLVAGALGCRLWVNGLDYNSLQGDRAILDIIDKSAGIAFIHSSNEFISKHGKIKPMSVDAKDIPDLVPALAALFCFAEGESKIYNAGRLRYKESDRLKAISQALKLLGADVRLYGDAMIIRGKKALKGNASIDPMGDHRIAMMAAVVASRCEGEVRVKDPGCVAKSYPGFWDDFCRDKKKAQAWA